MQIVSIAEVLEIAAKAEHLGPFLFAVLFNLVITLVAYRFYHRASIRNAPPASDTELKTYRTYFQLVSVFGVILVAVSIIWWFWQQETPHIYKAVINDLQSHEKIVLPPGSTNLYVRTELYYPFDDDTALRHEYFLLVKEKPFNEGEYFEISYAKSEEATGKRQHKFRIEVIPGTEGVFEIDARSGTPTLKSKILPVKKVEHALSWPILLSSAFAAPLPELRPVPQNAIMIVARQKDQTVEEGFGKLRQARSDVATKIAAMEQLEVASTVKEFLIQSPGDIVGLLDLTRHSDQELAYKAHKVVEAIDVDTLLATLLRSLDEKKKQIAEESMFRIDRTRAERILRDVLTHKDVDSEKLSRLLEEVKSGQKERLLIPTGSLRGDRYYVKAEWASENKQVVKCLTELFHRTLVSKRTLDEERQFMSGRSLRYVYDYEKDWALSIYDYIQECGGKATFVGL